MVALTISRFACTALSLSVARCASRWSVEFQQRGGNEKGYRRRKNPMALTDDKVNGKL
jgi:hypothetical protein